MGSASPMLVLIKLETVGAEPRVTKCIFDGCLKKPNGKGRAIAYLKASRE